MYYGGGFSQTVVLDAPTTQTTLTGLFQGTFYSISVSASTSKGNGTSFYIYIGTGNISELTFSLLNFNGEKITSKGEEKVNQIYKAKRECANGHPGDNNDKDSHAKVPKQLSMVA